MTDSHPYTALLPDLILDAVESAGYEVQGSLLALNSYENRVYQVGLADGGFIVAKFYRPGRWSDEAIREEHSYSLELAAAEIPVVAPLIGANGETLHQFEGFRFALFPRQGGHRPELEDLDTLFRIGRFIGRIHMVGAARPFEQRGGIDIEQMGEASAQFLLEQGFIPREHLAQYQSLTTTALSKVREGFARVGNYPRLRLHGDVHHGNILWRDQGPHFVDLDDCCSGPAVQDLWMLLHGERHEMRIQLAELVEGYQEFHDFHPRQLHLIEPLRTLRMLNYSAWLARRWSDPAFPQHFPWFNSGPYWDEQVLALREQIRRLDEAPLELGQ